MKTAARSYCDAVLGILCVRACAYIRTVAQPGKLGVTQMPCPRSLVNAVRLTECIR